MAIATDRARPDRRRSADRLGGIPASRVRWSPPPARPPSRMSSTSTTGRTGSASWWMACWWRKSWGLMSPVVSLLLAGSLLNYLKRHDLGKLVGADGMMRLFPGLVRIPDVAFISWKRYPKKRRKRGEIPTVAPDLVVEVLSKGNTPREMAPSSTSTFEPACFRSGTSIRNAGRFASSPIAITRSFWGKMSILTAATSFPASPFPSANGSARPNEPPRDDSPEPPRSCPASARLVIVAWAKNSDLTSGPSAARPGPEPHRRP